MRTEPEREKTGGEPNPGGVFYVDFAPVRMHRPVDLMGFGIHLLAAALLFVIALVGDATTTALVKDVKAATSGVLSNLVLIPFNVLEGLVTVLLPLVLLVLLGVQRRWRAAGMLLLSALASWGLTVFTVLMIRFHHLSDSALQLQAGGATFIDSAISPMFAMAAGALTAAAPSSRQRYVRASWIFFTFTAALGVLRGAESLIGIAIATVFGRLIGLGLRYLTGIEPNKTWGKTLVDAVFRAGIEPVRVVRADAFTQPGNASVWLVSTRAAVGHTEAASEAPSFLSITGGAAPLTLAGENWEEAARGLEPWPGFKEGESYRTYLVECVDGRVLEARVLDGNQRFFGFLESVWEAIRVREVNQKWSTTLRDTAQSQVLMWRSLQQTPALSPRVIGFTESPGAFVTLVEPVPVRATLEGLPTVSDGDLASAWEQLKHAHRAGLAHTDLGPANLLVAEAGGVVIDGWQLGSAAASELARRLDLAQMLVTQAIITSPQRAFEQASKCLTEQQLLAASPLLQRAAMPPQIREILRDKTRRGILDELGELMSGTLPVDTVEAVNVQRFSVKTIITWALAGVALWVVMGSLDYQQVWMALQSASAPWLAASFGLSLVTYAGAALTLVAFSPRRIGFLKTTVVQVAASLVGLAAPAGLGPAALNLRFLKKRGVSTGVSITTIALVQVSQFVTTVTVLLLISLASGSQGVISVPSGQVFIIVGLLLAGIASLFAFPWVRRWVWERIGSSVQQTWPRFLALVSSPLRLGLGFAGGIVMTIGYVSAFGATLAAFGFTLPIATLAITYLVSNTVGSVVPSPGGVGPVEAALTGGLAVAGIPYASALSIAVVFRLVTFWVRVPMGWLALRYLQKTGEV